MSTVDNTRARYQVLAKVNAALISTVCNCTAIVMEIYIITSTFANEELNQK